MADLFSHGSKVLSLYFLLFASWRSSACVCFKSCRESNTYCVTSCSMNSCKLERHTLRKTVKLFGLTKLCIYPPDVSVTSTTHVWCHRALTSKTPENKLRTRIRNLWSSLLGFETPSKNLRRLNVQTTGKSQQTCSSRGVVAATRTPPPRNVMRQSYPEQCSVFLRGVEFVGLGVRWADKVSRLPSAED